MSAWGGAGKTSLVTHWVLESGGRGKRSAVALLDRAGIFLDDMSPSDLERAIGVPVQVVEPSAAGFLQAVCSVR